MSDLLPLAGAVAALGIVLLVAGLRGLPPAPARDRARTRARRRDLSVRVELASVFGLGLLAFTGWPVTAVLGALLGASLPQLVSGRGEEKRAEARVEAIAGFAEQLRDTTAAGVGVVGAISAVAPRAPAAIRVDGAGQRSRSERLSQRQAATRAGVDQADVSRIESGQITPSLPTLLRLLDAVGATLVLARTTPSRPSTKRPPAAVAARKRPATAHASAARPTAGPARAGSIAQASVARGATGPAVLPKTRHRGTTSSSTTKVRTRASS